MLNVSPYSVCVIEDLPRNARKNCGLDENGILFSCPHLVHNTNMLSKLSSCMCHVLLVLSAADGFPIRICTICCELSRPPLA